MALAGCGGGDDTNSSTPPAKSEPFELDGTWEYLGPSDVPHDLKIQDSSMVYVGLDSNWSSNWTLKAYDNKAHHFQLVFGSGSGTYLPMGQSLSGSYEVQGTILTVQTAPGLASYPALMSAGACTGAADGNPIPDCRLYYLKQK